MFFSWTIAWYKFRLTILVFAATTMRMLKKLLVIALLLTFRLVGCDSAAIDEATEANEANEVEGQETQNVVLALPGKAFTATFRDPSDVFVDSESLFRINSLPITLDLSPNACFDCSSGSDSHDCDNETPVLDDAAQTARTVWDGAIALAKYLEYSATSLAGKRVIELGSGTTGVPGIAVLSCAVLLRLIALCDRLRCSVLMWLSPIYPKSCRL